MSGLAAHALFGTLGRAVRLGRRPSSPSTSWRPRSRSPCCDDREDGDAATGVVPAAAAFVGVVLLGGVNAVAVRVAISAQPRRGARIRQDVGHEPRAARLAAPVVGHPARLIPTRSRGVRVAAGTFGLRVRTVTEVSRAIRERVRSDDGLRDLWVEGEVGRVTVSTAGHAYFTLKDARAQLQCVWFRDDRVRSPFQPQTGLQVVAHGRMDVFEPQGALQLYVERSSRRASATSPSGSSS